jgi:hypothetical protein
MTYRRLDVPAYIGGLPAGYAYLNNELVGTPAVVDPAKAGGPNDGTFFVAFGEDGRSGAVNRGLSALAENTDFIDNFLHADFAVLASVDIAASGSAIVPGSVSVPVFVGPPGTTNNQVGLEPYFHITDQNNHDIVDTATNNQVVVTAASAGVGTFHTANITLTLNIIPSVPYRIWYGKRSSLLEMKRDSFVLSSVWGVQHKQAGLLQFINDLKSTTAGKGAELVGINTTGFTSSVQDGTGGGGIGTTVTTVKQALQAVNDRLVQRRAFTAVMTDGTLSVGGDYNGTVIDQAINDMVAGIFMLRRGLFTISNGVAAALSTVLTFIGEANSFLGLNSARTFDLTLQGDTRLDGVVLSSLSASKARFAYASGSPATYFSLSRAILQAGCLLGFSGVGGNLSLEDVFVSGTLGSTNAALDLAGEMKVSLRRCSFTEANGSPSRNVYFHSFTDPTLSTITVEDCLFQANAANVHGAQLFGVAVPTVFRNCVFDLTVSTGTGYALFAESCGDLTFDNCTFRTSNGQAVWVDDSRVNFINCRMFSDDVVSQAATSQMVMINGSSSGVSKILGLTITIGASAVKGVGATIQRAIVELGGKNNVATNNCSLYADGIHIAYSSGVASAHNFTTVLLHGGTTSSGDVRFQNIYRDITFDENHVSVNNTGTLGGVYVSHPCFVEVGGADSRTQCLVENLKIVDVKNPSTTHNRRVLSGRKAIFRDVTVEGSTVASVGFYAQALIEFSECDVNDMYVSKALSIDCSGTAQVLLNDSTRWKGGEFNGRTGVIPVLAWIQLGSNYCEIESVRCFWSSATVASTAACIRASAAGAGVIGCQMYIDGSFAAAMILGTAAAELMRITHNRLFWKRATADIATSSGAASNVSDNILTSSVSTPTLVVVGTGSVNDGNVLTTVTAPGNPL